MIHGTRSKHRDRHLTVQAILDTGVTDSMGTQDVVKALQLEPIAHQVVQTCNGPFESELYLVNFQLSDKITHTGIAVARGIVDGGQALLGLDVILKGDLCIVNDDKGILLEYVMPSHSSPSIAKRAGRQPRREQI